jgi:TM2 domain-containing membrane protein YozV
VGLLKCYKHNDVEAVGICTGCGNAVCPDCMTSVNGRIVCQECLRKMASQTVAVRRKEPVLSLILSFLLPGVGQVYNGQVRKGLIMLVVYILLWWTCIVTLVLWIYGMYDGYTTAERINRGETVGDWLN